MQHYNHVNECKSQIIKFMRGIIEIYRHVSVVEFSSKIKKIKHEK